jgi:hypothetical protein
LAWAAAGGIAGALAIGLAPLSRLPTGRSRRRGFWRTQSCCRATGLTGATRGAGARAAVSRPAPLDCHLTTAVRAHARALALLPFSASVLASFPFGLAPVYGWDAQCDGEAQRHPAS